MKARKLTTLLLVMTAALVMTAGLTATAFGAVKAPAQVKGLKVTKATNNSIAVSWKKAARAKQYRLLYKVSSAKKWTVLKTKKLTATVSKLKASTKYSFKVRAVNGKKLGKFSKVIKQTTFATPGKVNIKTVFAKERTSHNITLQWSKAANASYYEIEAFEVGGDSYGLQQAPVSAVYETVHQASPNTWYGYKIRTVNTKTGKFAAVKSAWTAVYYTSTTFGERILKAEKMSNGRFKYSLTGGTPFRIGEDEGIIPKGYVVTTDEYGTYQDCDELVCESIIFPAAFEPSEGDKDLVKGKTIKVGDAFDGDYVETIKLQIHFDYDAEYPSGEIYVRIVKASGGDQEYVYRP